LALLLLLPLTTTTTTTTTTKGGALRRRDHNRGDRSIDPHRVFLLIVFQNASFPKDVFPKRKALLLRAN
jgi:hypothetical protein